MYVGWTMIRIEATDETENYVMARLFMESSCCDRMYEHLFFYLIIHSKGPNWPLMLRRRI